MVWLLVLRTIQLSIGLDLVVESLPPLYARILRARKLSWLNARSDHHIRTRRTL